MWAEVNLGGCFILYGKEILNSTTSFPAAQNGYVRNEREHQFSR